MLVGRADQPVVERVTLLGLRVSACTSAPAEKPRRLDDQLTWHYRQPTGAQQSGSERTGSWVSGIQAITLFVEDLDATKLFYQEVFQLPVTFEDPDSAVFRFGDTLINLLIVDAAPELVEPAAVASPEAGSRFQFTVGVDDVDRMCGELTPRGVTLLNGPMDRPWGVRTASFRDPGGHILGDRTRDTGSRLSALAVSSSSIVKAS